jgi:hypothetical protein
MIESRKRLKEEGGGKREEGGKRKEEEGRRKEKGKEDGKKRRKDEGGRRGKRTNQVSATLVRALPQVKTACRAPVSLNTNIKHPRRFPR